MWVSGNVLVVSKILIASDSPSVLAEVESVLHARDHDVVTVTSGAEVRSAAKTESPDLAVFDFQIGSMGGVAACLDLRLEHSGGRLPAIPVLLLLDRRADVFLARRSGAQGFLLKPLDPIRVRKAVTKLLAGENYEDASFAPATIPAR